MNKYYTPSGPKLAIYGIIILACFLAMAFFVRNMQVEYAPAPINEARVKERVEARKKIAAESQEALNNPGWADEARGLVRLPISRAMQMVVRMYQNPEAARSNLLERVELATAPLPEQPSLYE